MARSEDDNRGGSSPDPGQASADAAALFERWFAPIVRRMWPADIHGLEHLPSHDDVILIANHSGLGGAEVLSFIERWYRDFGNQRRIAGMAHPAGFRVQPLRALLRGFGAVEATDEGAAWARRHGAWLLLFPGGDYEATRPFYRAKEVDFCGRKGWIRIARKHGLTIVPLCITGSHQTNPVLLHGRWVAWATGLRLLGVRRSGITLLSALLASVAFWQSRRRGAAWWKGIAIALPLMGATTIIPWLPARIGFHFLEPIEIGAASDDEVYARVVQAIGNQLRSS